MDAKELATRFIVMDLTPLDYILDITIDYNKCNREGKDYDIVKMAIHETINNIVNLRDDYDERNNK